MVVEKKSRVVEELAKLLDENNYIVATDYRGLKVAEISELRRQLRNIGSEYHVVKNTLLNFAAEKSGKSAISAVLKGPTALAFSKDDIVQVVKTILDYARASKTTLSIKGGMVNLQFFGAGQAAGIATLPPVDVLRARVLGQLLSPIYALHTVLTANLRSLNTVLNARIQQLGGTSVQ